MTPKRKPPNIKEKLDAALLALLEAKGTPIGREEAKGLGAGSVASRFDWDHWPVPFAHGGTNHPSNLQPLLRAEHRLKTAKRDIPAIAKAKRLSKAQEASRARILAKVNGEVAAIMAKPKFKAKIQSRGFDKTKIKHLNGRISDR